MDQKHLYYFAYGMLTDPNTMDHNEFLGRGKVNNYAFEFRYFANVIKSSGSHVFGSVWYITKEELAYLDEVEGYPLMYTRVRVPVELEDGETVIAEMYTMTEDTRERVGPASPKTQYMNRLLSGYRHANIPISQLETALHKLYQQEK